ncbi:MAG: demethoxyubiquinone hydroxylase family protein [Alphaproteobacteria bacterium]|nr:MAG: demethoxyubiquinone hydroxylase family protein [Alphaproteobacteria bacterium]
MTHMRRPGDPLAADTVARTVRVDHAGEYGAVRIYQGQLAVLGRSGVAPTLKHMLEQERQHLSHFEGELRQRRVRPTALLPLWHVAGFALGAATALMGEKAAMACTIAVEETIDEHYRSQHAALGPDEAALKERIDQFRQEELDHRDEAEARGGREAPGYGLLYGAVRTGSRLAIWLSERV